MRGYAVLTGTFNGTAFDWKMDSIIPNAVMKSDGISKQLSEGQMVWNQAGTVGYVIGVGAVANATLANRSLQPIIYKMDKTVGAGATWTLMNGMDFNTTYSMIPSHLPNIKITYPVLDTTAVPFMIDFDAAVDANNDLHLGAVFLSGYSSHPDSLQYYSTFASTINPTENYKWQHRPGERPYIWDFIGNGVAPWKVVLVDSMSSEGPGVTTTSSGYNDNPWDNTGTNGQKISIDGRLQLGRTPDGQYITFSWAESDTLYTSSFFKYNTLPDIKSRCMAVSSASLPHMMDIGPEINISSVSNDVRARATLHFMSPTTSAATVVPALPSAPLFTVNIKTPFTVTNSNPYSQLTNNATWYSKNTLEYKFKKPFVDGVTDIEGSLASSRIYPNPAQNSAVLSMVLDESAKVTVKVLNTVGQVMRMQNFNANAGENRTLIDVSNLAPGIYMINIKAGELNSTKKLIVE
jgi:hypothetical protein